MDEQQSATIEYRLSKIEKSLEELKNVIIDNKMQARDIEEMKDQIGTLSATCASNEHRIRDLELAPQKGKADKYSQILDMVFKAVVSAVIIIVLTRVGLK